MKKSIYVYKSLCQLYVDVSQFFQNVRNLQSEKEVTWDETDFQFLGCKLTARHVSSSGEKHFHFDA